MGSALSARRGSDERCLFLLQDFVMGLSILLRGTVQEKLNWAFNLYDINKDGYITKEVGVVTSLVTCRRIGFNHY